MTAYDLVKAGSFSKVDILTRIHPSWVEYNFWAEHKFQIGLTDWLGMALSLYFEDIRLTGDGEAKMEGDYIGCFRVPHQRPRWRRL